MYCFVAQSDVISVLSTMYYFLYFVSATIKRCYQQR